eukprot:CAMPEP_0178934892 /NCGR_PEP_ID=MMETSP0786-20121207/24173_1 /TAXON_ID=186022 /ORGANISM="Thalassionema frauenfeldii, Strain CCMP 1798" /LENGTH=1153 /DNA_ID=CAMNT_0020612841 /DNA_START=338 /DNA_END=3799 /DNA_ORIENTATION=+
MEANYNLALLDPPKFGWTAVGNVQSIITPHEDLKRRLRKGRRRRNIGVHSTAGKKNPSNQTTKAALDIEGKARGINPALAVTNDSYPKAKSPLGISLNDDLNQLEKEHSARKDGAFPNQSLLPQGCRSVEFTNANDSTVLQVKSIQNDGILDMYTYHNGREGLEILDELQPNDTGTANWMGPKSIKPEIRIEFPLGCGEKWSETLTWNLEDDNTSTPLAFATNVAENFGLDFGATIDLAKSIEAQLYAATRSGDAYPETTTTLRDYSTGKDRPLVRPHHSQWYGTTDQPGNGGFPTVIRPKTLKAITPACANKSKNPSRPATSKSHTAAASNNKFSFRTEKIYRDEVTERARRECKIAFSSTELQLKSNQVCHICQSKKLHCIEFACQHALHCYCYDHMESVLGITVMKNSEMTLDYCPICCMSCPCLKCKRKLDVIAFEFQKETLSQEKKISETVFENILGRATPRANTLNKKLVPKVPRTHFPAELCGERDLEPGSDADYRTVFTSEGAYLLSPTSSSLTALVEFPSTLQRDPNRMDEDGNVDYCQECRKTGNLLCCDYCPRAFHKSCVDKENRDSSENKWKCYVCHQEEAGFPEDKVTGNKEYKDGKACLDIIFEAFAMIQSREIESEDYLKFLRALGIILEMIRDLIQYDFGYMFKEPVDLDAVPHYSTIVKNPMDLGTLSLRLVNGHYAKLYQEGHCIDDILVQVLNDVELIWHNCYTFNFEGSSIYRMAQVLSRRSKKILEASLDKDVWNDSVKNRVSEYVEECNSYRNTLSKKATSISEHKIYVNFAPGGFTRIIAVFDPETGLVVKQYTTLKAAIQAAYYLTTLGHEAEWSISDYTIKNCIKKSKSDPKLTLFGYRWVYFDDLCLNQVKLPENVQNALDYDWSLKTADSFVQMTTGKETYIFLSIAEAISCSELPKNVPLAELMHRLQASPLNEWVSLAGFKWRKFLRDKKASDIMIPVTEGDTIKKKCVAFLKEDTCSGRKLTGFDTIEAAYGDWCRTIEMSPLRKFHSVNMSLERFEKDFIDGKKQIDGIVWISTLKRQKEKKRLKQEKALSAAKTALKKRAEDGMMHPPPDAKKQALGKVATSSDPSKSALKAKAIQSTGNIDDETVPQSISQKPNGMLSREERKDQDQEFNKLNKQDMAFS